MLAHVVDAARAATSLRRILLVAGAHRLPAFDGVEVAECSAWAEGQSASLRCGLEALGGAEAVVVLLGDQPGVTGAAIDRIAALPPGTRAAYDGRPGHPALLGPEQIAAAARLTGDAGLRGLPWRLVECGDVASGDDVDTPEDLERSRAGGR